MANTPWTVPSSKTIVPSNLQNKSPFFNRKSSFSGAILHYLCNIFNRKFQNILAFMLQFAVLVTVTPRLPVPTFEKSSLCNTKFIIFNTKIIIFREQMRRLCSSLCQSDPGVQLDVQGCIWYKCIIFSAGFIIFSAKFIIFSAKYLSVYHSRAR